MVRQWRHGERSHGPQTGKREAAPSYWEQLFLISAQSCWAAGRAWSASKIPVTGTFIRAVQIIQEVVIIRQSSGLYLSAEWYTSSNTHTMPGIHDNASLKGFLSYRLVRCAPFLADESIHQPCLLPSSGLPHLLPTGLCSPASPSSSYWPSSYLWRASSSLAVIFWKKPICWRRWCCICERKSRTRVRWKCWISASVAQEIMLQRSCSSPSCFGQSFTLVRAPGRRKDKERTERGQHMYSITLKGDILCNFSTDQKFPGVFKTCLWHVFWSNVRVQLIHFTV